MIIPMHEDATAKSPVIGGTSPVLSRDAETASLTAEVLRTTGDDAVDRAHAEQAARMQLEILGELQTKDSSESGEPSIAREDIPGGVPADEMEWKEVATEVSEMIAGGTVDYILLKDQNGEVVGYANTEVMPLYEESSNKRDATLFIWVIGIRRPLRGSGAARVLNEKIMDVALEQARRRNLHIVSVSMESGRDVEAKFHKHWGASGIYMEHPQSRSLVEAPYIPPLSSVSGGIATEDPQNPHSKWLIGTLDESTVITPAEFLANTDLVYAGYCEERCEPYRRAIEKIQCFTRDLIGEVMQGKPLRLVGHPERKQMEEGGQEIIGPQKFAAWLEQYFPHLRARFRGIVEQLKKTYD